jgi:hypothetical protein
MATKPVSKRAVQRFYDRWIEAGRPKIAEYARQIKMDDTTARRWLNKYAVELGISAEEQRAAVQGFAPDQDMTHVVPAPFVVRGVSTYYNKDGDRAGQWVKTALDDKAAEAAMRAAVEALAIEIPRARPAKAPRHTAGNLCTVYTLTDCHVGMKAWAPETGADWDLDIAEQVLTDAIDYLVDASPAASTCVVNQLGDWLHFDSLAAVTPTSGHILDADSRYSKVVRVATRILRRVIDKALGKHGRVVVVMAEGNHDLASSVWLRHLFALLYEREPRVTVLDSEIPYYVHVHGKTMLAFHHGHLKKNDQLPLLFASQYPQEWGATTKRYAHTGHRHHTEEKEHSGMSVVQHATIAARDAYAARGGWLAERKIKAITYHSEFGETGTITVTPEMLKAAA